MKKSILFAALVLAASASFAQVTGFVKYDYDRAEGTPQFSVHRSSTGLKYDFGNGAGAIDVATAGGQLVIGGDRVNGLGGDIGYSNGVKFGKFGLNGRIGYTRYEAGTVGTVGRNTHVESWHYSVEGSYPVSTAVVAFAGVEHINGKISTTIADEQLQYSSSGNRYTVGADIAVTDKLSARVGFARAVAFGHTGNGITTALNYKF